MAIAAGADVNASHIISPKFMYDNLVLKTADGETLTKFAKFLRPMTRGKVEIIALKICHIIDTLSEIRLKSNAIKRKYHNKAPGAKAKLG